MPKPDDYQFAYELLEVLIAAGRAVSLTVLLKHYGKDGHLGEDGFTRNALEARLARMVDAKWLRERPDGYLPHPDFIGLSVRARRAYADGAKDLLELIQACY